MLFTIYLIEISKRNPSFGSATSLDYRPTTPSGNFEPELCNIRKVTVYFLFPSPSISHVFDDDRLK